jgi:hypothetical protein
MNKLKTSVLTAAAFLCLVGGTSETYAKGMEIELKSIPSFLNRVFVPVVPETDNTFSVESAPVTDVLTAPAGYRIERSGKGLVIHAPAGETAGYAKVIMGGRELTLTIMNLVPYSSLKRGFLEGYRIGEYLSKPLKGLRQYEQPKGFIRLTPANQDLWVSDRYRLRDFQCKLDGKSKFLIVRSEALVKLELLQHSLQTRHGLAFDRFTIMSGYRTPYYNSMIGNETGYSRHLYGDAMDIYVDQDRNGSMDDLNGDGRIDTNDAKFLLHVAEAIDKSSDWGWLKGGAGVYKANSAHGPYVHVDTRGYVARWGV